MSNNSLNNQYQFAQQTVNSNNLGNWQFITPSTSNTITTSGTTLTPNYGYTIPSAYTTYGFNNHNKSVYERLQDLKTVEKLKKDYGLEDFHIIFDYHNLAPEYVFLTEEEMVYFKKYSVGIKEVMDPYEFDAMMASKSYVFVLGSTGEKYKDIEELRKDYMVLKLAGI